MNKTFKSLMAIFGLLVVALIVIWRIGWIGLWSEGIGFIANNTEEFSDKEGHIVEGSYSVLIDLSDLKSNIGKELYNDGSHRILVAWVNETGSSDTGGVDIGFRSIGEYSLDGATLVSGNRHKTNHDLSFTTEMSASMTAQYGAEQYGGTVSGISGLNYKNGDDFSFHAFPSQALKDKGQLEVTISNLYMNIWRGVK